MNVERAPRQVLLPNPRYDRLASLLGGCFVFALSYHQLAPLCKGGGQAGRVEVTR
jgi:hypothetical protein